MRCLKTNNSNLITSLQLKINFITAHNTQFIHISTYIKTQQFFVVVQNYSDFFWHFVFQKPFSHELEKQTHNATLHAFVYLAHTAHLISFFLFHFQDENNIYIYICVACRIIYLSCNNGRYHVSLSICKFYLYLVVD